MAPTVSSPLSVTEVNNQRLQEFLHWILKKIAVADIRRVLEFGCGAGELTRVLTEYLPRAYIIAVDPSPRAIRAARELTAPAQYPQVEFRTVQTDALPFRKGEFDFVLCSRTLLSRENPKVLLAELARVLQFDGRLLAIELDRVGAAILESEKSLPNANLARRLPMLMREVGLVPTDLFPFFLVSREPLTREMLLRADPTVKNLRPRLRHLTRFDFDDYLSHLKKTVKAKSGGEATLFDIGVVGQKVVG